MDIQFLTIELIEVVDSLHVWWGDKIKEMREESRMTFQSSRENKGEECGVLEAEYR